MRSSIVKFIFIVSLALNISVIGTVGFLYYKQSGYWVTPFGKKIPSGRFLFEELSLRPEQLKEMKARAMQFRSEIDRERREITQKRKELIALMRADTPDVHSIKTIVAGINAMQGEMQTKIAVHMLEEKARLDENQQKQFFDLIENAMTQGRQMECPPSTDHD
ncbi:MAG: periplasmic heavy metal sensor [Nitrospirae bacterium]|nr:periplasmic heavy metal sensor [Nitrospirota bacterium]